MEPTSTPESAREPGTARIQPLMAALLLHVPGGLFQLEIWHIDHEPWGSPFPPDMTLWLEGALVLVGLALLVVPKTRRDAEASAFATWLLLGAAAFWTGLVAFAFGPGIHV